MKPIIQFIKGVEETTIPTINITRSTDGTTGTATFIFEDPSLFYTGINPESEISGMFLIDEEGILTTNDLNAKFIEGQPKTLEALSMLLVENGTNQVDLVVGWENTMARLPIMLK